VANVVVSVGVVPVGLAKVLAASRSKAKLLAPAPPPLLEASSVTGSPGAGIAGLCVSVAVSDGATLIV